MRFVDVVFPENIGALTYRVPEHLAGEIEAGALVSAPLRKSVKRGVVLGPQESPPKGRLKDVTEVLGDGPALNSAMLSLIPWMADYYFAPEGIVLKSMLPREFFERVKARAPRKAVEQAAPPYSASDARLSKKALAGVEEMRKGIGSGKYGAYLYHAPDTRHELAFVLEALREAGPAIVLYPEHAGLRRLEPLVGAACEGKAVLYRSGLSRGARSKVLDEIMGGSTGVVVGSRSAVFAPLSEVSLIVVMHEENVSYKAEMGVPYSARDMAVLRAFKEDATVLLCSVCPSVESWHNCRTGKYKLIDDSRPASRPTVRIIDMRRTRGAVSITVRKAAKTQEARDGRMLFVMNRRGYSALQCADCGSLLPCPRCGAALVYHKEEGSVRCSSCGYSAAPPDACPECGGLLETAGAGIERAVEELRVFGAEKELGVISETDASVVVGTKRMARAALAGGQYALAVHLNADSYRFIPDFRATERAFQELVYLADKVSVNGQLIVQSRSPRAPLLEHLRRFEFSRFYREELEARKELGYPPHSRLVLLTMPQDSALPTGLLPAGVDVMGPLPGITKRGRRVTKLLLKSGSRDALREAVRIFTRGVKGKVTVDADPIWV